VSAQAPLPPEYFDRPTLEVARDLLGCVLMSDSPAGRASGRIVETEGYIARIDPAAHAYRGRTVRNAPMWGSPGHAYIYFTYGMHYCTNVVTEADGVAAAVLIRALEPLEGLDLMAERRGVENPQLLCAGPARLSQALGLDARLSGAPLQGPDVFIYPGEPPTEIVATTRIGISRGKDLPWRYYPVGSPWVSRK